MSEQQMSETASVQWWKLAADFLAGRLTLGSPAGRKTGPKTLPLAAKLKRRIAVQQGANGCWLWTGGTNPAGYGTLSVAGRQVLAHRAAYESWVGPIPMGLCVLHTCDVRNCIRPDHLFLGTKADNNLDMLAKGRLRFKRHKGENNGCAKLTSEAVLAVREAGLSKSQRAWAAELGVSQATIHNILTGKAWVHLGGPRLHTCSRRGDTHPCSKLTEQEVEEIKRIGRSMSLRELSVKFGGADPSLLSRILRGKSRAYINGPTQKTLAPFHRPGGGS